MEFVAETKKDFLDDSYKFETDANIVYFLRDEDFESGKGFIICDRTIFYPQGGGQPTDEGEIVLNSHVFKVTMVKMNENQCIIHNGTGSAEFWTELESKNCKVNLQINQRLRELYTRLHSAGHALDVAMRNVGCAGRLLGLKGYHFLDSPYVEYILKGEILTPKEMEALPNLLTIELKKLVYENIPTIIQDKVPKDIVSTWDDCRNVDLIHYPDSIRMVSICGMYIACGGTHVRSSGEIGPEIEVTRIKKKKNMYKVSYTIAGL